MRHASGCPLNPSDAANQAKEKYNRHVSDVTRLVRSLCKFQDYLRM